MGTQTDGPGRPGEDGEGKSGGRRILVCKTTVRRDPAEQANRDQGCGRGKGCLYVLVCLALFLLFLLFLLLLLPFLFLLRRFKGGLVGYTLICAIPLTDTSFLNRVFLLPRELEGAKLKHIGRLGIGLPGRVVFDTAIHLFSSDLYYHLCIIENSVISHLLILLSSPS